MSPPRGYNSDDETVATIQQVRRNLKALGLGLVKLSENLSEAEETLRELRAQQPSRD